MGVKNVKRRVGVCVSCFYDWLGVGILDVVRLFL